MHQDKPVQLVLENGMVFHGRSFGADRPASGKTAFSNGNISCPHYSEQILTLTYPLIGNFGIPKDTAINTISNLYKSEKYRQTALLFPIFCLNNTVIKHKQKIDSKELEIR